MKVISAEFVTSAALRPLDVPRAVPDGEGLARRRPPYGIVGVPNDGLPHIAMAGRSNVGKSTLINALGRRKVARTSAAPGKTRLANIYRLTVERGPGTWGLYLVDLPGYGYARGGTDAAAELQAVAEAYFAEGGSRIAGRGGARGALLLVDSRHPGLASDIQAGGWLASMGVEHRIVATKVDKLSRTERARHLKALELSFGMPPLAVSATSGEGMDALWKTIVSLASTGPE